MPPTFPPRYTQFLHALGNANSHPIAAEFGVYLYSRAHLAERNETYAIAQNAPDYWMIGQDGDIAFFIRRSGDDETLFACDLGALGTMSMTIVATDIDAFIRQIEQGDYAY